ncbi:MAG: hypothetical protein ACREMR_00785 [Gemmatimonadales bacterium]
MTTPERTTPFGLVFAELARERFPAIGDVLARDGLSSADRDRFVLLEPVGRLLREMIPEDSPPEALEAHVRLLHHAYRHWAAGGWVYRIGPAALERALSGGPIGSHLAHQALYLQMPELRIWGTPTAGEPAEPLDGMFVTETARRGEIAVLGVFGLRTDRPGFSAVGVEGHADAVDPSGAEIEVLAAREDGGPAFGPLLEGGREAGIHSLANPGELLLLTTRLLATLPPPLPGDRGMGKGERSTGDDVERFVDLA